MSPPFSYDVPPTVLSPFPVVSFYLLGCSVFYVDFVSPISPPVILITLSPTPAPSQRAGTGSSFSALHLLPAQLTSPLLHSSLLTRTHCFFCVFVNFFSCVSLLTLKHLPPHPLRCSGLALLCHLSLCMGGGMLHAVWHGGFGWSMGSEEPNDQRRGGKKLRSKDWDAWGVTTGLMGGTSIGIVGGNGDVCCCSVLTSVGQSFSLFYIPLYPFFCAALQLPLANDGHNRPDNPTHHHTALPARPRHMLSLPQTNYLTQRSLER